MKKELNKYDCFTLTSAGVAKLMRNESVNEESVQKFNALKNHIFMVICDPSCGSLYFTDGNSEDYYFGDFGKSEDEYIKDVFPLWKVLASYKFDVERDFRASVSANEKCERSKPDSPPSYHRTGSCPNYSVTGSQG